MAKPHHVREAKYAGSFYPAIKKQLSEMVDAMLDNAKVEKFDTPLKALIVPHAGYNYSGQIAAFAFKVLKKAKPSRIILFGPTHHEYVHKVYGFSGKWLTPLGEIKVSDHGLGVLENDHEHSLEVQVPFLQKVLKKFKFFPVIYGDISPQRLAAILDSAVDKKTVLIASSDLSHYLPYEQAKQIDARTIKSILSRDYFEFSHSGDGCGKIGISALLLLAKKYAWKPVLLDYRNSGDVTGEKKGVVGYAAIAFFEGGKNK